MNYFFTYGTLQRGGALHDYVRHTHYVGRGLTNPEYSLRSGGAFPAMVSGEEQVEGDVFSVSDDVEFEELMRFLDRVENVPTLYRRQTIPIQIQNGTDTHVLNAEAFVANPEMFPSRNSPYISGGLGAPLRWSVDRVISF